eukprot:CAMPEP_0168313402 /NCGR_PEP_ID=MMETSP0210-20121227/1775_1 /TAXON_ID=40633 /ORGANISM="Condylostoma magnum, Strain COL2" /LENGTH=85 /DNA_ID=CAMNT_0008269663 /DNA_START=1550 /DNA_END=1807 /DNA_ORIENTATION=-
MAEEEKKIEQKRKYAEDQAKKEELMREKARVPPTEMFLAKTEEFSEFDDKGIPTKDANGEVLKKSHRKRLEKEWKNQERLHKKFS